MAFMILKRIITVCGVLALAAIPSFADVVSGSPLQDYGNLDGCQGCLFPIIEFGAPTFGQTVTSYSFYDGDGSTVSGNVITPILFEETSSPGTFTIRGIGYQATGFTDNAINVEPFVLASGQSTVLNGNTFFGFVDGSANGSTTNSGTVSMNYPAGTGPVNYFSDSVGALAVGESVSFTSLEGIGQGSRTYALDVTTTTPEPGFYGLLALGLSGLVTIVSRRKKA
jgi:hypothetical protein